MPGSVQDDAHPTAVQVDRLVAGEVGYFSASIKAVADARVGDTITTRKNGSEQASESKRSISPGRASSHKQMVVENVEALPMVCIYPFKILSGIFLAL